MVIGIAKVYGENGHCISKIVNQEILYCYNYCLNLLFFLHFIVPN